MGIGGNFIHLDNDHAKKQYIAWGYPLGSKPQLNPFAWFDNIAEPAYFIYCYKPSLQIACNIFITKSFHQENNFIDKQLILPIQF